MDQTTERKSRVELLREAHPFLTETQASCMLVAHYKKVTSDPMFRGPEALEVQMVNWTDVLCRMNEHDLRNELARTAEHFPYSWAEMEDRLMNGTEEDD